MSHEIASKISLIVGNANALSVFSKIISQSDAGCDFLEVVSFLHDDDGNLVESRPEHPMAQFMWNDIRFDLGYTNGDVTQVAMSDLVLSEYSETKVLKAALAKFAELVCVQFEPKERKGIMMWKDLL